MGLFGNLKMISMNIGDQLTIAHDLITEGGQITFKKGQKVIINSIEKDDAKWSNMYGMWMPERIWGIKLEGHYGIYFLNAFKETQNK